MAVPPAGACRELRRGPGEENIRTPDTNRNGVPTLDRSADGVPRVNHEMASRIDGYQCRHEAAPYAPAERGKQAVQRTNERPARWRLAS
jgi:hypothetical protein